MNFLRYPSSDQRLLCSDEALSPERVGPLDELSTIARAAKEEKTASLKISCSSRCLKFSGKLPDVPMKLDAKRKKKRKAQNLWPTEEEKAALLLWHCGNGENCWTQPTSMKCQSVSMWSWS